jgi:hypothetical protein
VRFRFFIILGLTLATASIAGRARAEEPSPAAPVDPGGAAPSAGRVLSDAPPPGARTQLILAGAATTLVSYGLALGGSFLISEDDLRGSKDLRIPIAGPWMQLGQSGCPKNTPDSCTFQLVAGAILVVFDGIAQIGGLGMVGEGLFLKTSTAAPAPRKAEGPTVHAVPLQFGKDGMGLGFVGTF